MFKRFQFLIIFIRSRSSGAVSCKSFRLCGGYAKNTAKDNTSNLLETKVTCADKRVKCMGCIVACRQQSDTLLSFSTDSGHVLLLKVSNQKSYL